jgi:hypothetical protein
MPDDDPAHEAEAEYVDQQDREWADGSLPNTFPSGETVKADRRDARADHAPDRMPTPDEEAEAGERAADPQVAAASREATRHGVDQQGEGRL